MLNPPADVVVDDDVNVELSINDRRSSSSSSSKSLDL